MAVAPYNVYLNVYDLTPLNCYFYWLGFGIYHSGVEVHGTEYAFGAHDFPTSGVFEVEPKNTPGFAFRVSLLVGTTALGSREFRQFVEAAADEYAGDSYHLIAKNCNHFTNDLVHRLTGSRIPGWVNRLARLGWAVNCLLPESLRVNELAPQQEHILPPQTLQYSRLGTSIMPTSQASAHNRSASSVVSTTSSSPAIDVPGGVVKREQPGLGHDLDDPGMVTMASLLSYRWRGPEADVGGDWLPPRSQPPMMGALDADEDDETPVINGSAQKGGDEARERRRNGRLKGNAI